MSVTVVVNFQAAPGKTEELMSLLSEGRDISRSAEGCESFELFRREDEPSRFMFFERWATIEAHHHNMATNIVASGHLARILPLLVDLPDNAVVELVG